MLKEYHQLLSDSRVQSVLIEWDRKRAEECRKQGCPHCGGALDRADYERRPRGLPVGLKWALRRRISFCCRVCDRRTSPESIFFLRHKIFAFIAVFLTLSAYSGRLPGASIRLACKVSGASEVTLRRWRRWMSHFRESAEWRLLRKGLCALLDLKRFPWSLLEECRKQEKELFAAVVASLCVLSILSVQLF